VRKNDVHEESEVELGKAAVYMQAPGFRASAGHRIERAKIGPQFLGATMSELESLYRAHLTSLISIYERAMSASNFDTLLIYSGRLRYEFLDDRPLSFKTNPWFKHFLPLTHHPDCWLVLRLGQKPRLIYCQPDDYWHEVPSEPSGYWVPHFEIEIVRDESQALASLLPWLQHRRVALVGEQPPDIAGVSVNPNALIHHTHFDRGCKTEYELALMRKASAHAVRGHRAAEKAFRNDATEFEIHLTYLAAAGQVEAELPYTSIVALNQHAAILHYQHQRTEKPLQHLSFLIDAGASHLGYAADITRTYAKHAGFFQELIAHLDRAQLELVDQVRVGTDYRDIHLSTHLKIGQILERFKLVRMSAEAQVENGITSVFFPHGIGHLIGLQVHDVAGLCDRKGEPIARPAGHPFLRLTRQLEHNMVVTIEPGIYFIESLLTQLANGPHAGALAWSEIDALKHYGGIRIEDDVVAREGSPPINLSRDAFAALG
jgi:Xaa-Pro dipeptidase